MWDKCPFDGCNYALLQKSREADRDKSAPYNNDELADKTSANIQDEVQAERNAEDETHQKYCCRNHQLGIDDHGCRTEKSKKFLQLKKSAIDSDHQYKLQTLKDSLSHLISSDCSKLHKH